MPFHIQSYARTLNTQARKRDVLRSLRLNNFTGILCSWEVWALSTTCPYLICDLSPLVWTCYQLEPEDPLVWECVPSDTPRLLLTADRIWDGVWQPPCSPYLQKVTCSWLQVVPNQGTTPLAPGGPGWRSQLVAPWQERWQLCCSLSSDKSQRRSGSFLEFQLAMTPMAIQSLSYCKRGTTALSPSTSVGIWGPLSAKSLAPDFTNCPVKISTSFTGLSFISFRRGYHCRTKTVKRSL